MQKFEITGQVRNDCDISMPHYISSFINKKRPACQTIKAAGKSKLEMGGDINDPLSQPHLWKTHENLFCHFTSLWILKMDRRTMCINIMITIDCGWVEWIKRKGGWEKCDLLLLKCNSIFCCKWTWTFFLLLFDNANATLNGFVWDLSFQGHHMCPKSHMSS